jgi:predicted lactoylglutathione lyase
MTTTEAQRPVIRNVAGSRPPLRRKLFVTLPVENLQRSITFFEALGFHFNPQFTDATTTCMLVGEDAYVMLMTRERIAGFSKVPIADPRQVAIAGYALFLESRAAVDEMVHAALAAGGTASGEPQDHGFMYQRSFQDPDGHAWDAGWMDPAMVQE